MNNQRRSFYTDFLELCRTNSTADMILYESGFSTIKYSYGDVETIIRRMLALIKKNGLKPGDTILSILPNSPEAIILFFTVMIGGYDFAPLSCQATPREVNDWISVIEPKIAFKKEGTQTQTLSCHEIICKCDGEFSWLPAENADLCPPPQSRLYLMTSGTTGTPKAMVIDRDILWSSGHAFSQLYSLEDKKCRFWNYLPMSYLGGLFNLALIPLCTKGSFLVTEPFSGKTVLNFWNVIKRHRIDSLWLVPSIVQGLLKISMLVGGSCKTSKDIKIAFLGTAPISKKTKEAFEETFSILLFENFALSETTFLTAEDSKKIRFRQQSSVGMTLPYVDLKIVPIAEGEKIGEIWVKTPYLFCGYMEKNGKILLETDENGFFNTKDLGFINEDNQVVLSGRRRDIIKKGGFFVSLPEIEELLLQHEEIEDVSAVPIKHDFYGESYILCVVLKPRNKSGAEIKDRLHLWLLDNLVPYKMPESIELCNKFPRTASGKIQKQLLEEHYYAKQMMEDHDE